MHILSVRHSQGSVHLSDHYHDGHQLLYVVCGEARVRVGEREYHMGAGSLLILSRFESHAVHVLSTPYERYTVRISPEPTRETSEAGDLLGSVLVNRAEQFRHVVEMGEQATYVEQLLSDMEREYRGDAPMRDEVLGLLLRRLLIMLYRQAPRLFVREEGDSTLMIRRLQNRMESNYAEPTTLAELAAECHVSPSHLSHLFKRVTGYAPMAYLMACRLSAAKSELCRSRSSIREVAARCGFTDESNFCRTFRGFTGMTPTEFRRANGKVSPKDDK